jgi:hypothetical protein
MKPKEIFSLAVRILGLFFAYLAARNAASIWNGPGDQIIPSLLNAAFFAAVSWWLVGGAPLLMRRAYPEPDGTASATSGHQAEA